MREESLALAILELTKLNKNQVAPRKGRTVAGAVWFDSVATKLTTKNIHFVSKTINQSIRKLSKREETKRPAMFGRSRSRG